MRSNIKLGILGGGQLGKMILQASMKYNLQVSILDPNSNAPCSQYCKNYFIGDCTSENQVFEFGKNQDIITIEIENINIAALKKLEKLGVKIYPQPIVIELIQNKLLQKEFYSKNGIPTAPWEKLVLDKISTRKKQKYPCILKASKGGYDGKGVFNINCYDDLNALDPGEYVLEEKVKIKSELSVIVARNVKREINCFDPVEMVFDNETNMVDYLVFPSQINTTLLNKIKEIAIEVATKIDIIGILAVEFFVDENDRIYVNEMSPRPHNSGHYTIEACTVSQYDQLIRAIVDYPLGSTRLNFEGAMLNIVGEKGYSGNVKYEGIEDVLKIPNVYMHLYGKQITKPKRKMGHVTVLSNSSTDAIEKINKIKKTLKVIT